MKRFALSAALVICASALPLSAAVITATLPEFDGVYHDSGFPLSAVTVGSFNYSIPVGNHILSAIFSSTFGDSSFPNSAGVEVRVGGVLVGTCPALAVCDIGGSPTPFSYSFAQSEFAALASGSVPVTATQISGNITRLGTETLTITTALNTPEPASFALLGLGLTGLGLFRYRRRTS